MHGAADCQQLMEEIFFAFGLLGWLIILECTMQCTPQAVMTSPQVNVCSPLMLTDVCWDVNDSFFNSFFFFFFFGDAFPNSLFFILPDLHPTARPHTTKVIRETQAGNGPRWLTCIVQVYSESSSSLTVQLHSLSRLLMLLLISRLSIFSVVCVRDRSGAHTYKFGSAVTLTTPLPLLSGPTPGQRQRVCGAAAAVVHRLFHPHVSAGGGGGWCVSSLGARGFLENSATACTAAASLVRLDCHPSPHLPPSLVSSPLPCRSNAAGRAEEESGESASQRSCERGAAFIEGTSGDDIPIGCCSSWLQPHGWE